jgi:hypothetical protein
MCVKPNEIWIEFLSKFTKYDIYIILDDNSRDYKRDYYKFQFTNNKYTTFTNVINIIQIDDLECEKNGFSESTTVTIPKKVTSWDKAIYYFSSINKNYDKVWFFEDDVFFHNEQSLLNIDSK